MPKQLRLALIGFGSAAQAFARLLLAKERYLRDAFDAEVRVTAIAANRKGALLARDGIDLAAVLAHLQTHDIFPGAQRMDAFEVLRRADADAVVELSPLSIADGQPATDHIRAAFDRGMHVITANKGPIAWAFAELHARAATDGLTFLYETTVMDGAPVFNLAAHCLTGCEIRSFEGILNTTTNFILAEMENGRGFDTAVAEAQARGFAEADPSMDITGMDAAAKTCAILNALMGGQLVPPMIDTRGIENVTADDLRAAKARGETIKLVCRGWRDATGAHGRVAPEALPVSHPFAAVAGTSSVLSLETDLMGRLTLIEHDPEIEQTAYGIYSDMLRLLE